MTYIVWTLPHCPRCAAVKRALSDGGFSFEERNLADPRWAKDLARIKNEGFTSAPVVEREDGVFMEGERMLQGVRYGADA